MISELQIDNILGATAYGADGDKIGKVGGVYIDERTGTPEWLAVATGLFGTKESFVPAARCRLRRDGDVEVPFDKATVKDAPQMDTDHEALSPDQEHELYLHYRMDAPGPAGGGNIDRANVGETGHAMTRSEERLQVGTEQVPAGRARLRKYVVTENVQTTVPVSHEEVRIEREPITADNRGAAMSGAEITEDEVEVTLHAERPVVQTVTEPVERVGLTTDTVTEQETVTGQVRKERIETENPPKNPRS